MENAFPDFVHFLLSNKLFESIFFFSYFFLSAASTPHSRTMRLNRKLTADRSSTSISRCVLESAAGRPRRVCQQVACTLNTPTDLLAALQARSLQPYDPPSGPVWVNRETKKSSNESDTLSAFSIAHLHLVVCCDFCWVSAIWRCDCARQVGRHTRTYTHLPWQHRFTPLTIHSPNWSLRERSRCVHFPCCLTF